MTVTELIQKLQRLDRPDVDVFIPCPHCCGQRGADFDLLDAEYVVRMERDGGQAVLLGDPRQDCPGDRRSDSRLRVRKAALDMPRPSPLAWLPVRKNPHGHGADIRGGQGRPHSREQIPESPQSGTGDH